MLQENEQKKAVILAITAAIISVLLYHLAGKVISRFVSDDFLSAFLAEAVFAVLALVSVIQLKQTDLFHSDRALLKKGWKSAGMFFLAIAFYGLIALGRLPEATVTSIQLILFFGQVILIGFAEEVLYRGLIQRAFHQLFGEDSYAHVILAIVCTGAVFGISHLVNMDRGNPALAAVMQACANIFIGMYICSIFYRTSKNIWYVIILHSVYDCVALIADRRLSGVSLSDALNPAGTSISVQSTLTIVLIWGGIFLLATLIVLRPKKIKPLLESPAIK